MIKTSDWQKIYSAYSPKLLGICRRYIQDLHTAEDILQDSFIAAIQNVHQLKDEKMLFPWLKKIVVNNALQYLRKSSQEIFITDELPEITETPLAMNTSEEKTSILAYDFTPEELLDSIDSLPDHHKSVFNLYCIENYSHAEIARQLGITVNTSKSHLLRAKKAIQNHLLNTLQPETPKNKKKLTQLLVFIGLGSLLWGQTFRSKFSDFSIPALRNLDIPERIVSQNKISPVNHSGLKQMITWGISFSILIIIPVLVFRPGYNNTLFNTSTPSENETMPEESYPEEIQAGNLGTSNTVADFQDTKNHESTVKLLSGKEEISEEIPTSIRPKEHQTRIKDSMREDAPQKIIVIKKIIQRDTIYVER
ncbi:MAG: sigma-70 family RNA polymerase sigma factor [Chryseobacterium sp.]|jgi:RNA polymerase sigma factor (sigma-70 family)|uniref:RNA polymerase sigma factor n=1 Tax=Chryseobacterium sp. TaxID=1871047 RepID=UPI0028269E34|nr:sigma-70 family RNA polymerase sigma factor [Chryseobacterium sp.]MDR2238773.1 sigma-70 family RNA polymerase sigma factor [Chryseobacterium sp.]